MTIYHFFEYNLSERTYIHPSDWILRVQHQIERFNIGFCVYNIRFDMFNIGLTLLISDSACITSDRQIQLVWPPYYGH